MNLSLLLVKTLLTLTLAGGLAFNAAAQMPPVVLVLGDSLSAGYGLPQGKGWVDLLRGKIEAERYGFKVVNASISGETTLGGRNRLPPLLASHKPAIVIVELGANDALRGADLATTRANLKAIVDASRAASAEVLVIGMRIPPNYGPDYTTRFQGLFGEVAAASRSALVPFMLEDFATRRELFQEDGIHPVAAAQPLIVETVFPKLKPLLDRAKRRSEALSGRPAA
jgi:acyl-CoA thioesterase I